MTTAAAIAVPVECPEKALNKTKIALMGNHGLVFYTTICLSLKHSFDDTIPTACTNGRWIKYNTDFFMKQTPARRLGLMVHEIMHVAYNHMGRLLNKDMTKWNYACVEEHTPISMADGSTKPAKDVQVGEVLDTPFGPHPVLNRKDTPNREIMELVFANGYKLYCTPDHKILTEGGYLYAEQLEPGYHSCAVDAGYGRHTGEAPSVHGTQGNRHIAGTESSASIFTDGTTGTQSGPENGEEVQHRTADAPQRDRHGVLHRTDGWRGDLFVSGAQEGQPAVPSPVYQRDQHQPGFDGLVSGHGPQRYVGNEQQRQTMLEGTSQWSSDCSRDPAHAALRQDTAAEVRTDSSDCGGVRGTRQDPEPDTTHHEYVRGVEGIEYARLVSARRIAEKSSVIDFTTACQCFIAAGVVVHNCDYVINLQILDMGLELPPGGLVDRQYEGMSAEQVYDLLPTPPEDPAAHHFELSPGEDPKELQEHITDILVKAATQARMSGKPGAIPGDILIMLDALLNPVLPTKVLLKRFVSSVARDDYSWSRFNRRYFPRHYLPSLYSERLDHIAVAVDASCSVTDDEFLRSVSEIEGIFRTARPKKISVVIFDTGIRSVHVVRNVSQLLRIPFRGRGGTDIAPVINWIKEHKPRVTLVLSDGEFSFRAVENPKVPILWAINNHPSFEFEAPFGKVVRYGEPT